MSHREKGNLQNNTGRETQSNQKRCLDISLKCTLQKREVFEKSDLGSVFMLSLDYFSIRPRLFDQFVDISQQN